MTQLDRSVPTNPALPEQPYRWQDWLLAAATALLLLLHALIYAGQTPAGVPPDELAHLTYVDEVAQDGAWVPDYAGSRILPWKIAPNYLQHPPLYYWVLGFVGKWTGWDAFEDVAGFRIVSAVMVAMGMLLWAMTARGLGLSWWWTLPLCLSVNAVPMFAYLAGSVNNDAMSYLAVALGIFGLVNTHRWPRLAWYLGAFGLAMAMLNKATAALFLLGLFAFWLVHETRLSPRAPLLRNRHFLWASGLAMATVAAYFSWALIRFGTLFPHAGEAHPRMPLTGELLGTADLAWEFVAQLSKHFTMIASHASTIPLGRMLGQVLLLTFALPVLAVCWSQVTRRRDTRDWIVTAFFLATLVAMTVHFIVMVRTYHGYGQVFGLHPRYYAYLLPGLAIMACVRRSRFTRALLAVFCVTSCALLLIVPYRTVRTEQGRHHPKPSIVFPKGLTRTARMPEFVQRQGAGYVDELVLMNGMLTASGWGVDATSKSAARRVRIYYGGVELGSVGVDRLRPDVAKALGNAEAEKSGFQLQMTGVPFGIQACDMQIAVEQADGRNAQINYLGCR